MVLPRLIIEGLSVRDYAYLWIHGCCALHQWCSGAKGIDSQVIAHVKFLVADKVQVENRDLPGLEQLLQYLIENEGSPAEKYVPDQWNERRMS